MATTSPPPALDPSEQVRTDWLIRLDGLIDLVERSAVVQGWATRRIDKLMEDPEIGEYRAPALLVQRDLARLLLEPIGRSAPGVAGVVDLYRMPAYDDVVTLVYHQGRWVAPHLSIPASPTDHEPGGGPPAVTTEMIQALLADQVNGAS